jgi:hypothetical protein
MSACSVRGCYHKGHGSTVRTGDTITFYIAGAKQFSGVYRATSELFEEAEEQYRKTLEIDSNFAIAYKGLAEVHTLEGRYGEAIREIRKALEISGGSLLIRDDLGYVYALSGEPAKAKEVIQELKAAASRRYVPAYGIAVVYFGLGEVEAGFEWLERAYQEKCFLTFLKVDPIFDGVRRNPRFVSILRNMGLEK